MRKIPYYKCPICNQQFKTINGFGEHMNEVHPGEIPEGWSPLRYYYLILTGKDSGTCRMCKRDTRWIEEAGRYAKLCNRPECKEAFRNEFIQNMRKKYGRTHILDDYETQEKMLSGRNKTKIYTYHDGAKFSYTGELEGKFLKMLDTFLRYPSSDIVSPSPHMYVYYYDNPNDLDHVGNHMYIPDFYFPSLNLDVEIKTSRNIMKKFIDIDDVKEVMKDEAMKKQNRTNYLKIYEEDYTPFFAFLNIIKEIPPEDKDKKLFCVIPDKPDPALGRNHDMQMDKAEREGIKALESISNDIVEESVLISKNDIFSNFDKWKKGSSNILYITGLSGSGKTTLAEEYEKKYNAFMFEFDGIEKCYDSSGKGIINKIREIDSQYDKYYIGFHNKNASPNNISNIIWNAINEAIKIMKADKNVLYIAEGIQIFDFFDGPEFQNEPLIVKGTSAIISGFRGIKRDKNNIRYLIQQFRSRINTDKKLMSFKKSAVSESYIDPIMESYMNGEDICDIKDIIDNDIKTMDKKDEISPNYREVSLESIINSGSFMSSEDEAVTAALEIFQMISNDIKNHKNEIDSIEIATEGANYSSTNRNPVFIILTRGHTPLSYIIYEATKDKHSHASISFDIELLKMYSFGTKKIFPRELGFVETSYDDKIWGDIPTKYDLYVIYVNSEQRIQMQKTLDYFIQNSDKMKYHWAGLVQIFFKIKSTSKQAYICSQFVATILGSSIKLNRDPSLYRPSELSSIENVEWVCGGDSIRDYNSAKAIHALESIKKK